MSAHTWLLKHTPLFIRIGALAFEKWMDNQYFHFHFLIGGQYRQSDGSPQAKQLPHIPLCFWQRLLDSTRTVWETTMTDDSDTRFVWPPSATANSMALTIHNGRPRWPYRVSRIKCMVSSKDTMTTRKCQLQMRLLQSQPLSKTGSIAMGLPHPLWYWLWRRGLKRNTQSSRMRWRFGKY